MLTGSKAGLLDGAAFSALVARELSMRGASYMDLSGWLTERFGGVTSTHAKHLYLNLRCDHPDLGFADQVLTVLGHHLTDIEADVVTEPASAVGRGYLTDAQLKACHRMYMHGASLREVARTILPRTQYTSLDSCAIGIRNGFRRLCLPTRDRATVVAASNRSRAAKKAVRG